MRRRRTSNTMSNKRSRKKKPSFLYAERFKVLEYGLIGLLVLAFGAGALVYALKGRAATVSDGSLTPSPEPTADLSVRGMNVLNALEDAAIKVTRTDDGYTLTAPNGVSFSMQMESDDSGIRTLEIATQLCPDPTDDSAVSELLRGENARTVEALRTVFDAVMPVFHRSTADSETIVRQCQTVVLKGTPYAKKLGDYSVRILSDTDAIPQTATVSLARDR